MIEETRDPSSFIRDVARATRLRKKLLCAVRAMLGAAPNQRARKKSIVPSVAARESDSRSA
jgi:hypothetical protein